MSSGSQRCPKLEKVRAHARLRAHGLRPIRIWVPDVRSPVFEAEAHRQSLAVARSAQAGEDQDFIDSASDSAPMKRREIWTVASSQDYATKPCPAVIVQDDVSTRRRR